MAAPGTLSIIIPMLDEGGRIATLLGVLRSHFADAEIIVVDGGSADHSVAAAMPLADSVLLGPRGRARQMNLGAACAKHDWLCFLHADTQPEFDQSALLPLLGDEVLWAFCRVRLSGSQRILGLIAALMNLRSRLTRVATGDQCLLVRRSVFTRIEGFADIPLMEDVEICKRLRRLGRPLNPDLMVTTSGRRWVEQGAARTILRMWALRLAFWMGVPPAKLWAHYYGSRSPGSRES